MDNIGMSKSLNAFQDMLSGFSEAEKAKGLKKEEQRRWDTENAPPEGGWQPYLQAFADSQDAELDLSELRNVMSSTQPNMQQIYAILSKYDPSITPEDVTQASSESDQANAPASTKINSIVNAMAKRTQMQLPKGKMGAKAASEIRQLIQASGRQGTSMQRLGYQQTKGAQSQSNWQAGQTAATGRAEQSQENVEKRMAFDREKFAYTQKRDAQRQSNFVTKNAQNEQFKKASSLYAKHKSEFVLAQNSGLTAEMETAKANMDAKLFELIDMYEQDYPNSAQSYEMAIEIVDGLLWGTREEKKTVPYVSKAKTKTTSVQPVSSGATMGTTSSGAKVIIRKKP